MIYEAVFNRSSPCTQCYYRIKRFVSVKRNVKRCVVNVEETILLALKCVLVPTVKMTMIIRTMMNIFFDSEEDSDESCILFCK